MQLRVKLNFCGTEIPIAYRYMLQSLIYNGLSISKEYSTFIHDIGFISEKRKYKLFTFGPIVGEYRVNGKKIEFTNEAFFEIRSIYPNIIQILMTYFTGVKEIEIDNKKIAVMSCELDDIHIFTDLITINAISPIISYITNDDLQTVFFSPNDPSFYSLIINNARRKYEAAGFLYGGNLSISPLGDKHPKTVTRYKNMYITGYSGKFILSGEPQLLDFLYNVGIGAKNSQGFGMFELITDNCK